MMQPGGFPPGPGGPPPAPPYGPPPAPYGAPPYGAPPYGAPLAYPGPLPPPKSRKTLFIVLGVIAACFVLMIGGIVAVVVKATAPPRNAGHAFLNELRARDYDTAYRRASPDMQKNLNRQEFQKVVEDEMPEIADMTDVTFSSTQIVNDSACLVGSMDTTKGSVPIHMVLVNVSSYWRVQAVSKNSINGC